MTDGEWRSNQRGKSRLAAVISPHIEGPEETRGPELLLYARCGRVVLYTMQSVGCACEGGYNRGPRRIGSGNG